MSQEITLSDEAVRSLIPAFEHIREAVILFDKDKNVNYYNQSCTSLFQLEKKLEQNNPETLRTLFEEIIVDHNRILNDGTIERTDSSLATIAERKLTTRDSRTFRAKVHTTTLIGSKHTIIGYVVSIIDLSEIATLKNILNQGKKLENFGLHALAVGMSVLQRTTTGILISPLLRMTEWIGQQETQAKLSSTITSLTECFDYLVSTEISIRVQIAKDYLIAVKEQHLLLLLSYMTLHAARFVGQDGEIIISTSKFEPDVGITLLLEAESHAAPSMDTEDPLSQLILEEVEIPKQLEDDAQENLTHTGLMAAQQLAFQYRTKIEYQHSTDTLRMRIRLPISGER